MDIRNRIRLHCKEAGIYQSHGLFPEAKKCYARAVEMLRKTPEIENREQILSFIARRVRHLKKESDRLRKTEAASTLSACQHRIVEGHMFGPEADRTDEAAFEIAAALLGFGQFSSALGRFNKLLRHGALRVPAAKNMLRCQMAVSSVDMAVDQFRIWERNRRFPPSDLETVRIFLLGILKRKNIRIDLGPARAGPADTPEPREEAFFDIISAVLPYREGTKTVESPAFDATSQSGSVISLIVPDKERRVIAGIQSGSRIEQVHLFTPVAMFIDDCAVTAVNRIDAEPKKGDWTIVLRLLHRPS